MNGWTLDQIIYALRVGDLTPAELYETCKKNYQMDTLAFSQAILRLEEIGMVRRVNIVNEDNSASTVYRIDRVRQK